MSKLQFSVIEVLETAMGFGGTENVAVLPNEITKKLIGEYERLYLLEDLALTYFGEKESIPLDVDREIKALLGLRNQEFSTLEQLYALLDLCRVYFDKGGHDDTHTKRKIENLVFGRVEVAPESE